VDNYYQIKMHLRK